MKTKASKLTDQSGFTLIELLVVFSTIGLLASTILYATSIARQNARDVTRLDQLDQIQKAIELYILEYGKPPLIDQIGAGNYINTCYDFPAWDDLENALRPYIQRFPFDPANSTTQCYSYGPNIIAPPGSECVSGKYALFFATERMQFKIPKWDPNGNWYCLQ